MTFTLQLIIASEYVSLDGYFAGPNGEIDWFFRDKEIEKYSIDLIGTVDTILFGRVTYEMMVLDVYKQSYDPQNPVVCMDESPKQLIAETRIPVPASPEKPEKHDYEYERRRTCNIFISFEPLTGNRMVEVTGFQISSGAIGTFM